MKCILCPKDARKRGYCNSCYTVGLRNGSIQRKYTKDISITEIQKEFLTGCLLGDGWISNLKYGRKTPCFGIDRKQDDLDYLKWQFSFVENLCSRPISLKDRYNKTTEKTHKHCLFETRYLASLLDLRKLWYPEDKKIIPSNLKLTRLIMQIWYCDDGTLEMMNNGKYRIRFATNGFSKEDNLKLISLLEDRYGGKFSLHKDSDSYRIATDVKTAPLVMDDLKINFPPMKRKLP